MNIWVVEILAIYMTVPEKREGRGGVEGRAEVFVGALPQIRGQELQCIYATPLTMKSSQDYRLWG